MKTSVLMILTATVVIVGVSGHEQRLQERTARLVRSNVCPTASHKDRAQLRPRQIRPPSLISIKSQTRPDGLWSSCRGLSDKPLCWLRCLAFF
jgi:hypothetical protein